MLAATPRSRTPTLSSLAAELDVELGDSFVPAPQPRREPPPPRSAPPTAPPAAAVCPIPRPFRRPLSPPPAPASAFALDEADPLLPPPPASEQNLVPYMAAAAESVADPIADLTPEPTPSVFGDLLQDFERELAMPQNDDNDPETHFNLGIAFREMGLLDEAIGELQKVCRLAGQGLSPARTQEAYIWLATCFVEKSVPEASFKWFLRALEARPTRSRAPPSTTNWPAPTRLLDGNVRRSTTSWKSMAPTSTIATWPPASANCAPPSERASAG